MHSSHSRRTWQGREGSSCCLSVVYLDGCSVICVCVVILGLVLCDKSLAPLVGGLMSQVIGFSLGVWLLGFEPS
jgi:hypothetical protein